ncbi:hypothetical protein [Roseibium sp. MMSF_3412]|uniref:hypothetical protein n=1 Tax=Roseibium sp. MMSF_3412 TaxID=3046712 RepID=UPI00273F4DAF|nr:hypothetical protein [Roseibium sp. MMSF_3412]
MNVFLRVLADQVRLLSFRAFKPSLAEHWHIYLGWGLFTTWLVGIGRYWDHPSADWWQYAGLGSLGYVFALAAIVWAISAPLKPQNLSYRNILIFITLTSLPALLYAIPVERFMALSSAQLANVWFLLIVAAWRVVLFAVFLRRVGKLSEVAVVVATLLPLALIVTALTILNLEQAVFNIMGGLRDPTSNDRAYAILGAMTFFSVVATPVLLIMYAFLVIRIHSRKASG